MNDDKDKEIEKLIEEAKKGEMDNEELLEFVTKLQEDYPKLKKNKGEIKVMMGFQVHQNCLIHLIITYIMNVAIFLAIQGIFRFASYDKFLTLIITISMFTAYEFAIKQAIMKFIMPLAISSMGMIFSLIHFSGFLLLWKFYPEFEFGGFWRYLGFVLIFNIIRIALSRYIRMYSLQYAKED